MHNDEIIIEYNGIKRWGADAHEYINSQAAGIELIFERSRRHVSIMWLNTIPRRSIYSYPTLVKYYFAMFLNHMKFSSENYYGACVACGKCRYVGNMAYDKRLDMNVFICYDCIKEVYAIRNQSVTMGENTALICIHNGSGDRGGNSATNSNNHGHFLNAHGTNPGNIIDVVIYSSESHNLHFFHRLTFLIEDFYYPNIIRCRNMEKCAICACLEELCGCKAAYIAGKTLFIDINWEKMKLLGHMTDNQDVQCVLKRTFARAISY